MGIDVVDPVREALTDRLKSYFFGGFVLSWIAFHWEAFYVTLFISAEDLQNVTKLQYIDDLKYTWRTDWLGPILAGLITPSVILNVDRGLELFKDRCHQKWIRLGDDFAKGDVYPASERRELRARLGELDAKVEAAEEVVAKTKAKFADLIEKANINSNNAADWEKEAGKHLAEREKLQEELKNEAAKAKAEMTEVRAERKAERKKAADELATVQAQLAQRDLELRSQTAALIHESKEAHDKYVALQGELQHLQVTHHEAAQKNQELMRRVQELTGFQEWLRKREHTQLTAIKNYVDTLISTIHSQTPNEDMIRRTSDYLSGTVDSHLAALDRELSGPVPP